MIIKSFKFDNNKLNLFIQKILDYEYEMFRLVNSSNYVSCQDNPNIFREVRYSIFQLWPHELLSAYLTNLCDAMQNGRNLFTEKYARMDNLIPPINSNPIINKIVKIEAQWQAEIQYKYPALYSRFCRSTEESEESTNFSVYLRCELETYGDTTLTIYYEWVKQAKDSGINYSLLMLKNIIKKSGFENIQKAETFWSEHMLK